MEVLLMRLEEERKTLEESQDGSTRSWTLQRWTEAAQSGCAAHQLTLGRYLYHRSELGEGATDVSSTEGATTEPSSGSGALAQAEAAVQWLVMASRQGVDAATELLVTCLERGVGVTDSNKDDVRWCVNTPQYEKLARQAAKKLFRALSPVVDIGGDEGAALTAEQLKSGLNKLSCDKRERKLIEKAGKIKVDGKVTETDFINKMMKNLHGYGGVALHNLQQETEAGLYTSTSLLQKLWRYPGQTLSWLADHAIEVSGKQGMTWMRSLIPTNQIYMLIIFFLYSLISAPIIFWFLPLLVFYISLATLVICTLQMFYSRRKSRDVKALADMLHKFNESLSSDSAESAYSWNSLTPYVVFFSALVVAIPSFLMSDRTWIPCSEMTFISGFFTVGCFFALSDKYDYLAILSMVLDSVSTLPAFLEGFPRIPIVYQFLSFFLGAGFSVELLPDMYLQIGVPSLAYMVVPLLFLNMARQNSWQGTYKVLVPHLVCFFWWRLAMMFFRHSSWLGMIRASVGWVSFIVLLPLVVVVMLCGAAMYFSSVLTISNLLRVITTIMLLAIPAVFAFWAKTGFKVRGFSPDLKSGRVKAALAIIFALSVLPMAFLFSPPERDVHGHYVTWEQYGRLCSKPHWDQTNIADSMVTCSHLSGMMVEWTGKVKKIVIKKTENQAEVFMNILPWALGNYLRCTYGEEYPEDCGIIVDNFQREICQINKLQGRDCHMKNLARYTFEMWLTMPLDAENVHDVRVEATHWFMDSLLKISEGNEVEIRAALTSELGNIWPVLKLYHVKCLDCSEEVEYGTKGLTSKLIHTYGMMLHVKRAFQGVWNFFMAPVVEFYFSTAE